MQKLRFAVIGCGSLARQMHIPNIARIRRASLYLCCDTNVQALAACRGQFQPTRICTDWREALRDLNVAAICPATTERLLRPVIELAAELRKPVYVERPLAASRDEMYAIRCIVHKAKIPLCVGHNRRSSPAMRDAHRIFRAHMDAPFEAEVGLGSRRRCAADTSRRRHAFARPRQ